MTSFQFLPEYVDKIKWFDTSPDAGDPSCLCSLCELLIDEDEVPIRAVDTEKNLEARFHIKCFGTVTGEEIFALDDDEEIDEDEELP
ncbi:hypothetical protein ES703_45500 [subsurface metagenome]